MGEKRERNSGIICNIPHAGTDIPNWAWEDYTADWEEVNCFAKRLCDIRVDELFSFVPKKKKVQTSISRIVVDMERFKDDAFEDMSKIGMGWFYLKDERGREVRKSGATKQICSEIYDAYHKELEDKIEKALVENGSCWVLDCHSFPSDIEYTKYDPSEFPNVCIGYNDDVSCPKIVREKIREIFENAGYTVQYNVPFGGCLIPLKYANDLRVKGMMLELNRNSYLGQEDKMILLCEKVYTLLQEF